MDEKCWFCGVIDSDLVFDYEFDTFVHIKCIKDNIVLGNPEADLMSYLIED